MIGPVLLLSLMAQPAPLGHIGDIQARGLTAAAGGLIGATLTIDDDIMLCLGASCDYWLTYNSTGTQFELWTTDANGAGADGKILSCGDGGDDCTFTGVFTAGGVSVGDNVQMVLGDAGAADAYIDFDATNLRLYSAGVIALGAETKLADNIKLTLGNAGSTDSYLDFDATNLRIYSSGDIEFLASPIIGTIEVDADSGAVAFLNMEVSATPAAGTEESLTVQIDSNAHTKFYCEADSSGSIEDCHLIQSYAPALVPSSDQALAGDAAFDCDEGINRIAGSGGAVTLSAAPSINDGDVDGQICYVQGTSDANTVQINDNTNVQLAGGANFVMGAGDMLVLAWDSGDSNWYEISRSDN